MDTSKANNVCTNAYVLFRKSYLAEEEGDLEVHNLSVKMPFELHRQLTQLVHSEPGSVDARGKQELTIWRSFHAVACCWELQILYQLNLPPASRHGCTATTQLRQVLLYKTEV